MSGDAAGGKVRFNFGDGSNAEGEFGEATEHHYSRPGTFTISASDEEGHRGTTKFTVPDDAFDPKEPAEPSLTVPALTLHKGDADVSSETELNNGKGQSLHCTGEIRIADADAAGLKAADLTLTMPEFFGPGPGTDVTVAWADEDGDVVGTYPGKGGFPIVNPLAGKTTNHWSLASGSSVTDGDLDVITTILDAEGGTLTSAEWKLTVAS